MNRFDELTDRKNTNSAKFDEMEQKLGEGLLHLGVADMDYMSPQPIIDAIQKTAGKGIFGYTVLPENYRQMVCNWMSRKYGLKIREEWILFSPRINMAFNMAVETFTKTNDSIVLHTPAYTSLQDAIVKYERTMIDIPLRLHDDKYCMDMKELWQRTDKVSGLKMMFLCNPHNPTGRVWKREELRKIAGFCEENKLFLVSDEIHADFVKKGNEFCSMLEFQEQIGERLIVCNSITKTFNVPGIILSNIIIPNPAVRLKMEKTIDRWGLHNPNIFAAGIMEAAYTQCDEWLGDVNVYLEDNYHYLCAFVEKSLPKLKVIPSEGTYMAWIDFGRLGVSPKEMEDFLLKEAKVEVYMGSRYGTHTDNFIRINLGTSRKYLQQALMRIERAYSARFVN